jgi:hypothetical protein
VRSWRPAHAFWWRAFANGRSARFAFAYRFFSFPTFAKEPRLTAAWARSAGGVALAGRARTDRAVPRLPGSGPSGGGRFRGQSPRLAPCEVEPAAFELEQSAQLRLPRSAGPALCLARNAPVRITL